MRPTQPVVLRWSSVQGSCLRSHSQASISDPEHPSSHLHWNSLFYEISSALFLDAILDRSKEKGGNPEDGEFKARVSRSSKKRLDQLKGKM